MQHARPLPPFMVERYRHWLETMQPEQRSRLDQLATKGQSPAAMIIACCDSRVMATEIFGAEAGDYFVHRNIANLVPEYSPDGLPRATSATIEFAVTALRVRHLIVMGHSRCGGVEGCLDLETGGERAPDPDSFVADWLRILRPRVEGVVARGLDRDQTLRALEHEGVIHSLENLMSFPFVREAVKAGALEIHGVWKDIGAGRLEVYDPASASFRSLLVTDS